MTTYIRKNAWNNGGTFDNPDLLWYAKGVAAMMTRTLDDPNSWWFFAAIHGHNLGIWSNIPAPTQVPVAPVPAQSVQDKYWDQCQHQSWYFPPWHRGYLIALEAQIRTLIIELGGPQDWALPYWDYFGPDNEYKMPPAFAKEKLPDGTNNPLFVTARYGPKNDGNIYVVIPPLSQECQQNTIYTGSNSSTKKPGYGGPETGFSHDGATSGNLESNPHNKVHTQVGGGTAAHEGLMSDPDTAGLDPIFYLHHANIDRMWASWNDAGNANPDKANWLEGPAAVGEREFVMPMPDGTSWVYTPADVDSLSKLDYIYDDLSTGITTTRKNQLAIRLSKLGAPVDQISTAKLMDSGTNSEMIGANEGQLQLDGAGGRTSVKFDSKSLKSVSNSLLKASSTQLPDQIYLHIENVKGDRDSNMLSVIVNHQLAGHISLFGLRKASTPGGHGGGNGLTFMFDITDIIDNLHLSDELNKGTLDVTILPENPIHNNQQITIGRVSIYREQQQP